jgi:MFS family permease
LLLAAAFVAWELRMRAPMVPMRFFRSRAFTAGIAASFLFYASLYGTLFLLPQFFQTAQGHGPLGTGLRLLAWTATLLVTAPIAGVLVNRVGERPLVVLGLLLEAVGMAWIALIAAPDRAYVELVAPLIAAGTGLSMAMPAAQNAILGAVAAGEIGKASGTFNMLRFLGGVLGIALVVAVFAATGSVASPQEFTTGFAAAMGVSAALALAAAIAGLWLPARREAALAQAGAQA